MPETPPITMADLADEITEKTGPELTVPGALYAANHWAVAAGLAWAGAKDAPEMDRQALAQQVLMLQHNVNGIAHAIVGAEAAQAWSPDSTGVDVLRSAASSGT